MATKTSPVSTFCADCEAPIVLALLVMGYIIRHLFVRSRWGAAGRGLSFQKAFWKSELPACSRNMVSGLLQLPVELRSEVTQMLTIKDLFAVSQASCNSFQGLWENREVWFGLIKSRGLIIHRVPGLCDCGILREAFRKSVFSVDAAALKDLAAHDAQGLVCEASRVLRGLMPRDGAEQVQTLHDLVMQVLRAYDPATAQSRAIAETLLGTVHARSDLLTEPQIASIECAYSDTVEIHALMEKAAQDHVARMFEDAGRWSGGCFTPEQAIEEVNLSH